MSEAADLGCAMKWLRGNRTQASAARSVGLSPKSWSLYEQGKRYPRQRKQLEKIASGLGVGIEVLEAEIQYQRERRMDKEELELFDLRLTEVLGEMKRLWLKHLARAERASSVQVQ